MVEQLVNYRRGHDREGCRCSVSFFPKSLLGVEGAGRMLNDEKGPTRGRSGRDLLHYEKPSSRMRERCRFQDSPCRAVHNLTTLRDHYQLTELWISFKRA